MKKICLLLKTLILKQTALIALPRILLHTAKMLDFYVICKKKRFNNLQQDTKNCNKKCTSK